MGMLVLDRESKQGFHIGDNIEVVILQWDSKRVRIGIDAPRDMVVLRNELYLEKKRKEALEMEANGNK
jgi:carbon storage regulator